MAISIIPNPNARVSADMGGTPATAQVTYLLKRVTKYNNARVHLELSCSFGVDFPVNTQIASVPEGYRPSSAVYLPAWEKTQTLSFAGVVKVDTNGVVSQSNTNYMRDCLVNGWYDL